MTSPTNSGGDASSTPSPLEVRAEAVGDELDAFERASGLPGACPAEVENESRRLLALPPAALKRLTAAECGEAAFTLMQFAFYVQRAVNRQQARARWADESIRRMVAPRLGAVAGHSMDERRLLAVRESDAATRADRLRVEALLRLDRLSYLAGRVHEVARALMSLQKTRLGEP